MALADGSSSINTPKKKPAPYKPPSTAAGSNLVNSNQGSRAFAGRNPSLPANKPIPAPAYPSTQGILPYKSKIGYTSKLANTAASLLDAPYLVNYWLNDIVDYRKEIMDDRRDLAKEQYTNKQQEFDRKFDNALDEGRFNWIANHPDPESNPDGWKKLVDRKSPVDYSGINNRLEGFIEKLQGADRSDYYSPNSPYNLNRSFDNGLENYLDVQGQKRDDAMRAQLSEEENQAAIRLAMKEHAGEIAGQNALVAISKFINGPFNESARKSVVNKDSKNENADSFAGIETEGSLSGTVKKGSVKATGEKGAIGLRNPFSDLTDGDTFDAVTKSIPVVGPYLNAIGEDNLQAADEAMGNPVSELADYGMTAIDMLSRPLNAVAEATDATLALDKEKGKHGDNAGNAIKNLLTGNATFLGGNVLDSVDEIVNNPSNLGKIGSAAWKGLTNEYDAGFAGVIANEAARNPNQTVHDNETYQAWAGLGFDLVADPLNFVGVGLITKPASLANAAVRGRRLAGIERIANQEPELQRLAVGVHEQLRGISAESRLPDSPKSVNEVYDILTGARMNGTKTAPGRFATKASKIEYIKKAQQDLKALEWELRHYGTPINAKVNNLNDLRRVYSDVFDGLKTEASDLTYLDEVERTLQTKINKGELSPEEVRQIQDTIVGVPAVGKLIGDNGKLFSKSQKADELFTKVNTLRNADNVDPALMNKALAEAEAARKSIQDWPAGDFYDLLGPKWHYGSGLTREETNGLLTSSFQYLMRTDADFKRLYDETQALAKKSIPALRAKANSGDQIAKNSLENAQYRLSSNYKKLNNRQASAFLQAAQIRRATPGGKVARIEPERVKELENLRARIDEELARPNASYASVQDNVIDASDPNSKRIIENRESEFESRTDRIAGSGQKGMVDGLETGNTFHWETGGVGGGHVVEKQGATDFDLSQIGPEVWEPDPRFFDRHKHMEALKRAVNKELKDLQVFDRPTYIKNLPKFDDEITNLAQSVPARFLMDGNDISDAVSLVYVDPANLVSKVTDNAVSAGERAWAERLKNAVDEYTDARYLQEQEKVTRRNRENAMQDMLRSNLNWYKDQPVVMLDAKKRKAYNKIVDEFTRKNKGNQWFPAQDRQRIMNDIARETFDYVKAGLSEGVLGTSGHMDITMPLDRVLGLNSNPDDIYAALTSKLHNDQAKLMEMKRSVGKSMGAQEQINRINVKLRKIDKQLKAAKKDHFEARARGAQASREYAKRVQEESLLYLARRSIAAPEKKLTIHTVVGDYSLPSFSKLTRGVDTEAKNGAIATTFRNIFNDVFQPPSKEFGELADAYRQRTAQSARRIQVNLEELNGTLGKYPPEVRKNAFKAMLDGNPSAFTGTAEQYKDFTNAFDSIIKAFTEPEKIGGYYVNAHDINKYLNPDFKLRYPENVDSVDSLMKQIKLKAQQNSVESGKGKDAWKKDKAKYADPFDVSWQMRIAIEQARAQKSFMYALGETFGLKNVKSGLGEDQYYEAVQKLKKDHEFRSVEDLGPQYVFDKDTADLIDRMMKVLEPESFNNKKLEQLAKVTDEAIGYWKASVTIYNPAYWVKNGIGEIYMSFLAGVTDPTVYKTATNLVKHARGDGHKLDALKALHPWAEHIKNPQTGSRVAMRMANGRKVTYDDLLVAYHENSLKTGFFDNDLSRRMTPTRRKLEQYEGLNKIAKGHEKLRQAGEGYEDMLRMAHFIDYVKKSSKSFETAAKEAADEVRRYHFDYDDYSQLEKTVMLRAFPFYKWTRKAAPLMLQMLFMKPGKVSAPFKIANTASNEMSSQDIFNDENGWAPNYEGIAPEFVRNMWAYELFGDADNGTYGGIPLPTAETYTKLRSPGGAVGSMVTPLVKLPYTVGNELANDVINDDGVTDSTSVFDSFMNNLSPQTKFIGKGEDYKTDDFDTSNFSKSELFNFLTGIAVFDSEKDTGVPTDYNPSR